MSMEQIFVVWSDIVVLVVATAIAAVWTVLE